MIPPTYTVQIGRTSFLARVFIQDSTKGDGSGLTGLTNATSGLTCYRARDDDGNNGGTVVALASATKGTWTNKGFVEKDATNMPGWYEFGVENAAIATGSEAVDYVFKGAANMVVCSLHINLVAYNPQVASLQANVIQWNSTNVATPATAGVAEVNVKNVNNVSASSVTTVSANQGTTQPVNFTGTGASAYVKGDTIDVGGVAQTAGDLFNAITNIAVTGAALNATASSETLTTGTDTGGIANTYDLDAAFDTWTAAGNAIDGYYQFDLSATTGASPVTVAWDGYLSGVVNTMPVYYYNWAGTAWKQIGTILGIAGTVVGNENFDIPPGALGTGGNAGLVRIRFAQTSLTSGVLKTDRILLGYGQSLTPPTNWSSQVISAGGIADANVKQWNSTTVATPATAGIPDINVKNIVNVAAVLDANNLLKVDLEDIKGTASVGTAGSVGVDWGQVSNKTTTNALTGTTISSSQAVASVSGAVGSVTGNVGGSVVGDVQGKVLGGGASAFTAVGVQADVEKWGATAVAGTIPPDVVFIRSGTAQAGSTSSTIKLDSGASATDNLYQNEIVFIRSGTGAGQAAIISSYVGSTKVATIVGTWATTPDATSVFSLLPLGAVNATVSGGVNVTQWNGAGVATPNVAGVPIVDAKYLLGTVISTPATAGILDVNVKNIVNTTAAVDSNNYLKVDVEDVTGAAIVPVTTVDANMVSVGGKTMLSGTVDTATLAATTTNFETSFTANTDLFTNQGVFWTSGANAGLTSRVQTYTYTGNNKVKLTINALPTAPSNGDGFKVVGKIDS